MFLPLPVFLEKTKGVLEYLIGTPQFRVLAFQFNFSLRFSCI